jgi:5-formyltetrahydrofolate cyclo-ligase
MNMEETQLLKQDIRNDVISAVQAISQEVLQVKNEQIENRLFEFANFLEANISLLYIADVHEVDTKNIIKRCLAYKKIIALPAYNVEKFSITPYKVDNFKEDLKPGPRGLLEPDSTRCKAVPIDRIDIAIFPGIALDEKGGRIGSGKGFCDRLVPRLPVTTRKVALAYECQIVPQVPMESHDKYMDIIITEERIIYKI